jgi:2-(1,2-epoxy-1,2-dihydrophenyl)acetyl-CoA isomerase
MTLIRRDRRDHIELWTLDRPDRLNALPDLEDGEAFAAACEAVNADQGVRCVVLTGAGRAFSAGGDLKAMKDRRDLFAGSGAEIREGYRRVVHRIVRSLYGLEVPLIAAVNGPAMGLGCDIAGLADIRIASETASFGVPFLKLGILPGDGGAWLLPRAIGRARAMEMALLGEKIGAAKALEWGLVNRVVPDADLRATAIELAKELANGPASLGAIRTLIWESLDTDWTGQLQAERKAQKIAGKSEDFIEGVSAFLQKRVAAFKGR